MSLKKQFDAVKANDVGIIGDPIEHSLSPAMQNAAFKTWWGAFRDREEATPTYHRFHVKPDELKDAIALMKEFALRGLNVTVPHKVNVCSYLDELDSFAKKVGSVNTIVSEKGRLKGFNTDGDGFRRSLERDMNFEAEGKKVLVLGTGGTGRVLIAKLLDMNVEKVFVWNRSPIKKESLVLQDADVSSRLSLVETKEELYNASTSADLIVNATSVGLSAQDGLPAPNLEFHKDQFVFDVIYHRETAFMQAARKAGAHVFGGEGMFLYQGAKAFELWTGTPAPHDIMRVVISQSLKGKN